MITVFHAIQSLVPGAEISVGLYDQTVTWHRPETAPVTTEQIQAEQQRLQQAYDWDEYQRNRAREYPSIEEQLDALYHAGVFPAEMAAKIQAVKTKYPRYSPDHIQTAEQTAPTTMSVEAWLAQEATKVTAKQWVAQQKPTNHMTREQWLASQTAIATENNSTSTGNATVVRTMTTQEWLAEQTKMTADEWVAQQQQSAASMTREQWLASQVEVKTVHNATPTNLVTVTRTMTTEEWLREQASAINTQVMTREQWLNEQKQQDQPQKLTREEWLAEQANVGN
jgi:hypothetical protein